MIPVLTSSLAQPSCWACRLHCVGTGLQVICSCGYEARAVIGSTKRDHGRVFMYPHRCDACRSLVNVDLLKQPTVCPVCSSDKISRYGWCKPNRPKGTVRRWLQRLFGPRAQEAAPSGLSDLGGVVSATFCFALRSDFLLCAKGNQCPQCGQHDLSFELPDIWFD